MYQLAIARDFIAQHYLIGGDWGAENVRHSHPYRVEVRLRGAALNPHGYLVDIVELQTALTEIVGRFSDRTLNELASFADLNPSLERFAKVICDELSAKLDTSGLSLAVKLWENDNDWAAYGPD